MRRRERLLWPVAGVHPAVPVFDRANGIAVCKSVTCKCQQMIHRARVSIETPSVGRHRFLKFKCRSGP